MLMNRKAHHSTIKTLSICTATAVILVFALLATGMGQRRVSGVRTGRAKASRNAPRPQQPTRADNSGIPTTGPRGVTRTTAELMQAQATAPLAAAKPMQMERENSEPDYRPQDPNAKLVAATGSPAKANRVATANVFINAPQTVALNFNSVTAPTETSRFPPDTMGTVGPAQFMLAINGRLKTFNKTTGVADGALNVDPDVFFASVMTTVAPPGSNFTTDPQIRYDRLSGRWILIMIDLPSSSPSAFGDLPNRLLIAVSDAASAGVISGSTVWTLYFVQQDTVGGGPSNGEFLDYCSLGVDNNALYVGGVMYDAVGGNLKNTAGFVIRKSSVLSGGPVVTTAFRNLIGGGDGPNAPRGVDNYDPASNEGYFIGISNASLGRLIIRRISTPGGVPTISANIPLTVNATSNPINVDHLGDANGASGDLDTLKDRLFAAHIRNGRLWTAHANAVTSTGVSSEFDPERRNGVRWYELNGVRSSDNGGVPIVVQSGTIFDNASAVATARQYWMPSIIVSGQGHAALGFSTAGTPNRIDAATNGRLAGDALGTTQAVTIYTSSSTAYNPPADTGGVNGRRWGDYSFTSLDPLDDMTMWTIQQYCSATDTYGLRVAKLAAPPPVTPTSSAPSTVPVNSPSQNIIITGSTINGSGFYDPGANLAPPALPFNHISTTVSGGVTVNSTTYTNPNQITINISTVGTPVGSKNVTITNPDGQSVTVNGLINVVNPTAASAAISGRVVSSNGTPVGGVTMRLSGSTTNTTITDASGNYRFSNVDTGNFYTVRPELANFSFTPADRSFSLIADKTDAVFTAATDANATANAIDTNEYFVRQQYLDFLGREPEAGGFNYWTDQLNQCHSDAGCVHTRRLDISAAFFMSQEFRDTGSFVYRLYKVGLGRQLGYNEFSADRVQVVGGQNLEASRTAFADSFVTRAEFTARYQANQTAESFVDALLSNTGATADLLSRRAELISRYNEGTSLNASRALVLRSVADDTNFTNAVYNPSFVLFEYFGYLRRDAEPAGYNFWLNVLNQSDAGNYRGMVCSFVTSAEYQHRFGTVVSHSNAECSR